MKRGNMEWEEKEGEEREGEEEKEDKYDMIRNWVKIWNKCYYHSRIDDYLVTEIFMEHIWEKDWV